MTPTNCIECGRTLNGITFIDDKGQGPLCLDCLMDGRRKRPYTPGESGLFKKRDGTEIEESKRQ